MEHDRWLGDARGALKKILLNPVLAVAIDKYFLCVLRYPLFVDWDQEITPWAEAKRNNCRQGNIIPRLYLYILVVLR